MLPLPLPRPPLILASSSPYRRELLLRLRIPFDVMRPDVDESPHEGEPCETTAMRLSRAKAEAIAMLRPEAIVIGSDQVAESEGRTLGKPGTYHNAVAQLRGLSGKVARFHSGVCVIAPQVDETHRVRCEVATTTVLFRSLNDEEIDAYLRLETPYGCAGSAKAEALGIALLARIDSDDPTALIGLPLIRLVSMLRAIDYPILPAMSFTNFPT